MNEINYESYERYKEDVIIKGYVRYSDCYPVREAIVILKKKQEEDHFVYLTHAVTNKYGEFYFVITDITSFYKIEVFDNHHR